MYGRYPHCNLFKWTSGYVRLKHLKRIEVTDVQTGEVISIECEDVDQLIQCIRGTAERLDRAVLNAKDSPPTEEFIQMKQNKLKTSAKSSQLAGCDNKIWEYCCGDAGYGGKIQSTQAEIAKELGITPSRINRAFKRMKEAGMILSAGLDKGTPTFKIANAYGIKGKRELNNTDEMCTVIRMEDIKPHLRFAQQQ